MKKQTALLSTILTMFLMGCSDDAAQPWTPPSCEETGSCVVEPSCEETNSCEAEPPCDGAIDCEAEPPCGEEGDCDAEPSCEETGSCKESCDECIENDIFCDENDLVKCQPDKDGCLKLFVSKTCEAPLECNEEQGDCTEVPETCQPQCELGSLKCGEDAVFECVTDESGCVVYKQKEECIEGAFCDEATYTCVDSDKCEDECKVGETKCQDGEIMTCEASESLGCTLWSAPEACASGEICSSEKNNQCVSVCGADPKSITVVTSNDNKLNVREGASPNTAILGSLKNGSCIVRVDDKKYSGSGCKYNSTTYYWYKVKYDGKVGYVCSYFTNAKAKVTTESTQSRDEIIAKIALTSKYTVKKALKSKNLFLSKYCAKDGKCFSYWVYLPESYRKNMPMIMYLHGLSLKGDDYNVKDSKDYKMTKYGFAYEIKNNKASYDAVIVMPQLPSGKDVKLYNEPYPTDFKELVDKLADSLEIDKKRISAFGFSHGCYGLTRGFYKFGSYFSSAIAVGCRAQSNQTTANKQAKGFKTTPMWTFVGNSKGSEGADVNESVNKRLSHFCKLVRNNGGVCQHENLDGKPHNVINSNGTDKYSILRASKYKKDIIDWLTKKSR